MDGYVVGARDGNYGVVIVVTSSMYRFLWVGGCFLGVDCNGCAGGGRDSSCGCGFGVGVGVGSGSDNEVWDKECLRSII